MKLHCFRFMSLLLIALLAVSCSDSNEPDVVTPPDLHELGSFTDGEYTVIAYSEAPLSMGYERLWFEVHRNGEPMDQLHFHMTPMMHMAGHSHASPVEEPLGERDDHHGLFEGAAVFTMASGDMGSWELQLVVHDQTHSGLVIEGVIGVDVEVSGLVRSFESENGERYVLALVEPAEPETGLNDLRITLHRRASMMEFSPVTDAEIEVEPWMPGMDHGSTNNEDPIHDQLGHYLGVVNLNMTGNWELRFDISAGDEVLDRQTFVITF